MKRIEFILPIIRFAAMVIQSPFVRWTIENHLTRMHGVRSVYFLLATESEKVAAAISYRRENDNEIYRPCHSFIHEYGQHLGLDHNWHWTSEDALGVWLDAVVHNSFVHNSTLVNRASILMVTNEEHDKCKSCHPMFIPDNSDSTVFKIDKPGLFYFISEVAGHCDQGLKMIVKVLEPESSPPPGSPPPTLPPSTTESSSTIGVAVKEAGIISSSAAVVLTTMSFCGALFFM